MQFFTPPARTRFDLNFTFAGFAVRVHPLFWAMTFFLGGRSGDVIQLLIWIASVFVSILIHELGHSLVMRSYGINSHIILHMAGGLAVPESSRGENIDWKRHVLISLAGPFAGFLLAAFVLVVVIALGGSISFNWFLGIIPSPTAQLPNSSWIANSIVRTLLWINISWGFVNLLPVYPLDGGNIARHIFIRFDPWNGVSNSLWLSVITGAILALAGFFLLKSTYMALMFGLLAVQSYQMLQSYRGSRF